jgi:2-oxoglutarate ferredoxin oxidoreductase subunit alpha
MQYALNDLSWMIGGPQGSGVDSSATLFARSVAGAGLWVFGNREYHSNIKGEHSYYRVRVADRPLRSHVDPVHLLVTFEPATLAIHYKEVVAGGAVIFDPHKDLPEDFAESPALKAPVDYERIIAELAAETKLEAGRLAILKNTISVAASLALLEFDFAHIERALGAIFTGRKAKLAAVNVAAARKAYAAVPRELIEKFGYRLRATPDTGRRLLVNGVQAVALGKLKAGCRFQTYYPITPASDESVYLEGKPEFGMEVIQTEDEIAAVTMASGAAVTGVRASTSTSGPGFSLMVEGIGWAGMNEVPVVVFDYQRGGPATGLPTRHEQGDLLFAIRAAHGEFPRVVLAPGDIEECFAAAFDAFNYAERYQTPVIVLCDKALANSTQTVRPFDQTGLRIDRGRLAHDSELAGDGQFRRFAFTDDGISPRSLPGQRGGIFWMTGDEHDEAGHISEDPENRLRMHDKRMRKLALPLEDIPLDKQFTWHGPRAADFTIVSWGSPKGAILDAMPVLAAKGVRVNFLQLRLLWPFPAESVAAILCGAGKLVDVEMNYSGQLASLIREQTGIEITRRVLKWTGRPMSETEIVSAVEEIADKGATKVVLTYGL